METGPIRVGSAPAKYIRNTRAVVLEEWMDHTQPDVVFASGSPDDRRASDVLRRITDSDTILHSVHDDDWQAVTIKNCPLVLAGELEQATNQSFEVLSDWGEGVVVTDSLSLQIDKSRLSAELVGLGDYRSALETIENPEQVLHASTGLPAGYSRVWDGFQIVGVGPRNENLDHELLAVDCHPQGTVSCHTSKPGDFGLQALEQVGERTALRLRASGFESRESIAEASPESLREIDGVGDEKACRIRRSARALEDDEIIPTVEDPLPQKKPVFIDIETDGLSPTIIWLIGVLDGTGKDDNYVSFINKTPENPEKAVREFLSWFFSTASHRPLVAYGGWNFDFPVIEQQIIEHAPEYLEDWRDAYRFDPYRWAVNDGNAVLPGRTNKLEDVSRAVGFERTEQILDGGAVANAYQEWMTHRTASVEPDWERFQQYCKEDVLALAALYKSLRDTVRDHHDSKTLDSSPDTDRDESIQGTLEEWQ